MTSRSDLVALLREHGLRVTPQRRAILESFGDGPAEHLSADEVHSRAAAVLPEIGRGTVYAALAELTEVGVLSARGVPEPVRYETNTTPHQHFRCRLCLRLFDVDLPEPDAAPLATAGFSVERIVVTAEGVCADCNDFGEGLRAGAERARAKPSGDLPDGVAAGVVDTPLGAVSVGATGQGLVRVVFEDHADVERLEASRRRGSREARQHVADGKAAVADYFAGRPVRDCVIDFGSLAGAPTLAATMAIPRSQRASYESLDTPAGASERGRTLGANPLAVLIPCHRVTRGSQLPAEYVGGAERRSAMNELERA
ncbi:MAG TPA: transcriptional repressor [Thermoleophilaceae bacterium]|nr:transcriptional repressor [Thermoleophilaceae bacterium]